MDRNSTIGLVLIVAILIGYGVFVSPSKEDIAKQKVIQDSIAAVQAKQEANKKAATAVVSPSISPANDSIAPADSAAQALAFAKLEGRFGAFAAAAAGKEKETTIENEKFIVTFSNKGGRIKNVSLKTYNNFDGTPVQLFDPKSALFGFNFTQPGKGDFNTQDFFFQSTAANASLSGDNSVTISYTLPGANPAQQLELVYTLKGNAYDIDLQINTKGLSSVLDNSKKLQLKWEIEALAKEKGLALEQQHSGVYYKYAEEDRDYLSESSDDEELLEQKTNWVAFKQQFFSAVAISSDGFLAENSQLKIKALTDTVHTKAYAALLSLPLSAADGSAKLKLFFGPNEFELLKSYEVDQLDKIIDFGWGIFGTVNKYLIYYAYKGINSVFLSAGIAILLLTIVIKMALMPLTYKNYQSSAKMKILKPEVDAINAKLKDADPLKKQQEMMNLYRQTGVNPLAGCIPVLIQMPILYAMFRFFPACIELRQKSFLWADDLSAYDSIYELGFNIPLYGDHISLFTILMCASTFFYTRMNSSNMPAPQQGMPDMRMIMYIFPFMMLFFFNNYGSGLSWYYFAANLVTIAQTWIIRKYFVDEKKILAKIEENKKKGGKTGKSGFQQRLENMAQKRGVKLPK